MTSMLSILLALATVFGGANPATPGTGGSNNKPKGTQLSSGDVPPDSPSDNAQADIAVDEEYVRKILSSEVVALIRDGKRQEAADVIDRAERLLNEYSRNNDVPVWERSMARLFQLAEYRRASLRNNGENGSTSDSKDESSSGGLTSEQSKELADIRKEYGAASALARNGQDDEAQAKATAVKEALDKWVARTKVPAWHKTVSMAYQQVASLQDRLDADAGKTTGKQEGKGSKLKIGERAPLFSVAGLDGKPIILKQLAGKWVVLDFWATWCGPCRGEMTHLKELHKNFGNDRRFVLVSLTIDSKQDKPRTYVEENELKWSHGFLGQGWKAPLLQKYGVRGIPAIFLIDPSGKIAGVGLRGEMLKNAVAKHLGKALKKSK